ncbi:flagellar hook-length control protein FliK [Aeribacillus pallidus]|uniref:flagellar hook-length control protein FliK n=1 Tax=Aeribacillus pallidus TaxID=33936 RepID=UPI003D238879
MEVSLVKAGTPFLSSTPTTTKRNGTSFGAVFAQLQGKTTNSPFISNETNLPLSSHEVWKDIIRLLNEQVSFISPIQDGTAEEVTLQKTGLTNSELNDALNELINGLQRLEINDPIFQEQLHWLIKVQNQGDWSAVLSPLLSLLHMVPADKLSQLSSKHLKSVLYAAKMFEHVIRHMDGFGKRLEQANELQQLLRGMAQRLEPLIGNNNKAFLKQVYHHMSQSNTETGQSMTTLGGQLVKGSMFGWTETIGNGQSVFMQPSRAEQLMLTLTSQSKPLSYEQFVEEFTNILNRSSFMKGKGTEKLLIKLYPEHLGSLRIELIQKDGILTAKMLASTAAAKELLESQVQGLKSAFAQHQIQVEKIEISHGQLESQRFDKGGQQSRGEQEASQQESKQKQKEQSAESFDEFIKAVEIMEE